MILSQFMIQFWRNVSFESKSANECDYKTDFVVEHYGGGLMEKMKTEIYGRNNDDRI